MLYLLELSVYVCIVQWNLFKRTCNVDSTIFRYLIARRKEAEVKISLPCFLWMKIAVEIDVIPANWSFHTRENVAATKRRDYRRVIFFPRRSQIILGFTALSRHPNFAPMVRAMMSLSPQHTHTLITSYTHKLEFTWRAALPACFPPPRRSLSSSHKSSAETREVIILLCTHDERHSSPPPSSRRASSWKVSDDVNDNVDDGRQPSLNPPVLTRDTQNSATCRRRDRRGGEREGERDDRVKGR